VWAFYLGLTDQLGADPMRTLERSLRSSRAISWMAITSIRTKSTASRDVALIPVARLDNIEEAEDDRQAERGSLWEIDGKVATAGDEWLDLGLDHCADCAKSSLLKISKTTLG